MSSERGLIFSPEDAVMILIQHYEIKIKKIKKTWMKHKIYKAAFRK